MTTGRINQVTHSQTAFIFLTCNSSLQELPSANEELSGRYCHFLSIQISCSSQSKAHWGDVNAWLGLFESAIKDSCFLLPSLEKQNLALFSILRKFQAHSSPESGLLKKRQKARSQSGVFPNHAFIIRQTWRWDLRRPCISKTGHCKGVFVVVLQKLLQYTKKTFLLFRPFFEKLLGTAICSAFPHPVWIPVRQRRNRWDGKRFLDDPCFWLE